LSQTTRTIPFRRTILHRSHNLLTELRTFIGVSPWLCGKVAASLAKIRTQCKRKIELFQKKLFAGRAFAAPRSILPQIRFKTSNLKSQNQNKESF